MEILELVCLFEHILLTLQLATTIQEKMQNQYVLQKVLLKKGILGHAWKVAYSMCMFICTYY